MAIDGIGAYTENWRTKPLKEIITKIDVVEDEDSECAKWAQAMSAVTNVPDNVTYDMAGGSIEEFSAQLDEISRNGLPIDEQSEVMPPEDVEGVGKVDEIEAEDETATIGDVDNADDEMLKAETAMTNDPNAAEKTNLIGEPGANDPMSKGEDITLADSSIMTDNEAIRKRKIKKGEALE